METFVSQMHKQTALQHPNINALQATHTPPSQIPKLIICHCSAHTHTQLHTAACRGPALGGLTLQHAQSWDFPTPPRMLSYILCHSHRAALQDRRQLRAHSHIFTGFA